jgi:hypothetical protein
MAGGQVGGPAAGAGRRVAGRSLGWALALGFLVDIVGIATQVVYDIVADEQSPPWLLGAFIGGGAMLALTKVGLDIGRARDDRSVSSPVTAPAPPPGAGPGYPGGYHYLPPRTPRRRGGTVPALVGVVVVLILCGVGGVGVAWAASRVTEFARTTFESPFAEAARISAAPGVRRLAAPVTAREGTLTVTVTEVEVNTVTTSVTMTVRTSGEHSVVLPQSQITVPGAATLRSAFGLGTWSDVPAGGEMTGTIVYEGAVGSDVASVTLSFTQIFGGLDDPRNMSITIALSAT